MTTDESRPAYVWSQHLLDYWAEWAPRMRNESDWKWLAAHILQIYIDGQPAAQSERRKGERRNQLCAIWYEKRKADRRQPAAREPVGQVVAWRYRSYEDRYERWGRWHYVEYEPQNKNEPGFQWQPLRASEPAEGGA